MHHRLLLVLFIALIGLFLVGCAAGPNKMVDSPDSKGGIAGFWKGVWHGVISPVTFIISLFNSNIHFYEVHNNGGWYNFGFVIGAGMLFGGSVSSRKCDD